MMMTGASAFQNSCRKRARGSSALAQRGIARAASTAGSLAGGVSGSTVSGCAAHAPGVPAKRCTRACAASSTCRSNDALLMAMLLQ